MHDVRLATVDDSAALARIRWVWGAAHRELGSGELQRRTGDIQSVLVLPEHRRRGLGRRMLDLLLAEADARRIRIVQVHSHAPAHAFYERCGFEHTMDFMKRELPA